MITRLHIESSGSGKDLVLLHGWGMHGGIWDSVKEKLAQRFRVHAVDLPGYGSSASCEPYTLEHIAQTLAQTLPEKVQVCGWSLGGQVALAWAQQAPQQVERLVLVASTPCFTLRDDWQHGISREVFDEFARNLQQDYTATLKRFLSLQARSGDDARKIMAALRSNLFARGQPATATLQSGLRILLESDLRDSIDHVAQPALLVHGDHDTLAPPGAAHWLQQHLPQARLEIIEGGAHAPFLSHQKICIELMMGFFA